MYPLDSSFASRADPSIRPSLTRGRTEFTYFPGMIRIPEGSAPDFKNKSWTVAAEVKIPDGGANGVLATIGGRFGGWALLLRDSKPEFVYAFSNQPQDKFRIASDQPIPPGNHIISSSSPMTEAASAKARPAPCSSTKSRLPKEKFRRRSAFASRSTRPSMSGRTRERR